MKEIQEQLNRLMQQVDDLETQNNEIVAENKELTERLDELQEKFNNHNHNEFDGSKILDSHIPEIAKTGDIVSYGVGSISTVNYGLDGLYESMILSTGDKATPSVNANSFEEQYNTSHIGLAKIRQGGIVSSEITSAGAPNLAHPLSSKLSTTAGTSTMSSGDLTLRAGALKDCVITLMDLNSDGAGINTEQYFILDNTENEITIRGTFNNTRSGFLYIINGQQSIGNGLNRFSQLYLKGRPFVDGGQTFYLMTGMGLLGKAVGIYTCEGVPTFSANNGSLCIDTSGGRLYVRQAGSWVIK